MMAQCDPRRGTNAISAFNQVWSQVQQEIKIPEGYTMKYFGEQESQVESNEALAKNLPLYVGGETAEINAMQFVVEVERRKLNKTQLYAGRKVGEEKNTFFQQADIFILPTMNECFPLVILEAMEYKLPVISTNEGGIPDIVKDGENGLICEKQNPSHLASKMTKGKHSFIVGRINISAC